MLCFSKSPQKQIDRATCLNKLQASGLCFMKIWVIGSWWCCTCTAQPSFTLLSLLPPLAVSLSVLRCHSVSRSYKQATELWKPGLKSRTNSCWFYEMNVWPVCQSPSLPSSMMFFPTDHTWSGLTIKAVRVWSTWWGSDWPIPRGSGNGTGLWQLACQIWAQSRYHPYISLYITI